MTFRPSNHGSYGQGWIPDWIPVIGTREKAAAYQTALGVSREDRVQSYTAPTTPTAPEFVPSGPPVYDPSTLPPVQGGDSSFPDWVVPVALIGTAVLVAGGFWWSTE